MDIPQDDGGSQINIYAVQLTQGGTSLMVKEPGLSTTVTGLEADTDYSVQVAACNAVRMGAWSAAATVRTDPESQLSTENSQPAQTSGDGNNGGGGGGSDENDDVIVILGTCSTGEWVGHDHPNDSNYWASTVNCLAESLINFIDPTTRGRMWSKSMMADHRHPGFTDATHWGSSCNADHVAAHASHGVLPCSSQ